MKTVDHWRSLRSAFLFSGVVLASLSQTGCASSRLMMRYGEMETQTELTSSVFLDLRSDFPKTVFVAENSTVDHEVTVLPTLQEQLIEAGYTLVDEPADATYLVQINHLQLVEAELSEDQTVSDAVRASLTAGATASLAADLLGASGSASGQIGLAVGLLGFIADSKTKHIAHTLTSDVLITESAPGGGGGPESRYHETRVVSGASKVNLDLGEALPAMVRNLSGSVSRLLPRTEGSQ